MGLLDLWQSARHQLDTKHIAQIIAFAGRGRLTDQSEASHELRAFLAQLPSHLIARYADECLGARFEDSGLALQDIVNELGQRLGFAVTPGRYRAQRDAVGFDGLWRTPDGHSIVIEVKTSDAHRIELGRLEGYRRELAERGALAPERSSVLLVVGRQATEDLEAQLRGSRYAWDMRLISVEGLLRLVRLREAVDDPRIVQQIAAILLPREFTRLDAIVEILLATAEEVRPEDIRPEDLAAPQPPPDPSPQPPQEPPQAPQEPRPSSPEAWALFRQRFSPQAFHEACIARVEDHLGRTLVKRSKTGYLSPDQSVAVVCLVSRAHLRTRHVEFWFALYPHHLQTLHSVEEGWLALGCGLDTYILLIPLEHIEPWLAALPLRSDDARPCWHLRLHANADAFTLHVGGEHPDVDLTPHLLPIGAWLPPGAEIGAVEDL